MVDKDTVYEDTFTLLYNTIDNNVTDPLSGSRSHSKWIYASFPSTRKGSFPGYPIIVISPVDTPSIRGMNISRSMWMHDIVITLSVYDTKATRLDTLSSLIVKKLRDTRATLRAGGLANQAITSGASGTDVVEGKKIHYRNVIMGFNFAN